MLSAIPVFRLYLNGHQAELAPEFSMPMSKENELVLRGRDNEQSQQTCWKRQMHEGLTNVTV